MILNGHGMSVLATHLDSFIGCGGYIYQTKQRLVNSKISKAVAQEERKG